MARLTEGEVSRLITALGHTASSQTRDAAHSSPALALTASSVEAARQRLSDLESSGALGPHLTQCLAAYLGRPVRCTCITTPVREPTVSYAGRAGETLLWLRMESSLASMLADAMLGGEGNPKSVGFNGRVVRLAAAPALQILRSLAQALGLPEPAAVEEAARVDEPAVSCLLGLGVEEHAWGAGLAPVALMQSPPPESTQARAAEELQPAVQGDIPAAPDLDSALESARGKLADLLGTQVSFERRTVLWLTGGNMPHGWIRLGLASHGGGASVLAVDRTTAVAIVQTASGSTELEGTASGLVMETGAEVVLREMLCALAAALGSAHEELHHVVRLTDDAIVADLPHVGVEHDVTWSGRTGHMRWLVPAHLVRPLADQLSKK